ncbi:MAG: uncharacterized protein A8A55_1497 [Amphiamblys sp. WSBS2006]|nr:MAG: uncharacterized protein A8A55_1497 [Amphiamblys sp. WSBS2006]
MECLFCFKAGLLERRGEELLFDERKGRACLFRGKKGGYSLGWFGRRSTVCEKSVDVRRRTQLRYIEETPCPGRVFQIRTDDEEVFFWVQEERPVDVVSEISKLFQSSPHTKRSVCIEGVFQSKRLRADAK